jgi:acyl-CoA dehydrogenase
VTFSGFALADDLAMLAEVVARFVAERIRPAEDKLPAEARRLPNDVLDALRPEARALGLWCFDAPAEHGGAGLSEFQTVVVCEQACKHRFCFPLTGGGVFGHSPPNILYEGTSDQITRWVKPAIEQGRTAFSAIAEPSGGSDPARAIRTTARRNSEGWVLDGTKMWITHADYAEYGVVYARTEQGVSAFVLDAANPGIEIRPIPMLRDAWRARFASISASCRPMHLSVLKVTGWLWQADG